MLAAGSDEVLQRVLDAAGRDRRHPFEAKALVVQREMWLTQPFGTTHRLLPGDGFRLQQDVPHEERYSPGGATYWVARRNR